MEDLIVTSKGMKSDISRLTTELSESKRTIMKLERSFNMALTEDQR